MSYYIILTIIYLIFGLIGWLINSIASSPGGYKVGQYTNCPTGKFESWGYHNQRLSKEAKRTVDILCYLLWLPFMLANILYCIYWLIKTLFLGVGNLVWVITTDKIAKEAKIEAKQFDNWVSQMEEFIDSIPSKSSTSQSEEEVND